MDPGELQPLQNLNQLTELNLMLCENLIGQSVSEICAGTTRELTHWLIPGTLAPLATLVQLKTLNLYGTSFTGQSESEICAGTTNAIFHSLSVSV